MFRLTTILCACITLILFNAGLADQGLADLGADSDSGKSYAAKLSGHDGDGEFSAVYFYSDDLRILKRRDKKGVTIYRYQKSKRPDKVMVTRSGVSYFYRLDNPGLPNYFLNSLDVYLADSEEFGSTETTEFEFETEDGSKVQVKDFTYNPTKDDPRFKDVTRYKKSK